MAGAELVVGGVEGRSLEAGEHPVVALGVVARAVVDGAEDRQPIHPPAPARAVARRQWTPGTTGGDGAERSAESTRGVGLGVPGLHVPRTAAEPEQDDALRDRFPTDRGRSSNPQQVG